MEDLSAAILTLLPAGPRNSGRATPYLQDLGSGGARTEALAANLAALCVTDSRLAEALSPAPIEPLDVYSLESAKVASREAVGGTGFTAQAPLPDGRLIYLHTRLDPAEEARKLVDSSHARGKSVVYVHGLGLGHAIANLQPDLPDETLVLVFEPDLKLIRTALMLYDFSSLIEAGKLMFITRLERIELFDKIGPKGALLTVGCASIIHLPSLRRAGDFHGQMQQWVVDYTGFSRTGINTLVANGRKTAENVIVNTARYATRPGIDSWRDRFTGRPAIVVAAGPSLRKNIGTLKEAKGRAVLIAVQTALKPLLAAGITPDIVTSLDYHSVCARFFQGLPGGAARLASLLVVEAKAAPEVMDLYPGPVAVVGNTYAENLLRELKLDRATLPAGATVAHLAFYLARFLGCDPIAFVGQDLGFSDGLCYVPGTGYDDVWQMEVSAFCSPEQKQWEQIARDRNILRQVPDVFGRPMYTEERLFTYLQQFERDFVGSRQQIFDCTEGGALKKGATPMSLSDFLTRYALQVFPMDLRSENPVTEIPDVHASLVARLAEAREIIRVGLETLPLLEQIRANIGHHETVNRLIGKIDRLRTQMDKYGPTYELVQQFDQTAELARFQADQRIVEQKLAGEALQQAQIARDIENVKSLLQAARAFAAHVEGVVAGLAVRGDVVGGERVVADLAEAA